MLSALAFILTHYLAIAILAVLSCGLGCTITRRLTYHSIWERIAMGTGLGLGAIASLVFVLGLLRLIYPALVIGLLVIIGAVCLPTFKEVVQDVNRSFKGSRKVVCVGAIVCLLLLLRISTPALYPPFFPDATGYHLALAKIVLQSHQVVMTPYLRYPVFPILNEMLFSLSLLLYDDILAQLVQFLMMLLVAVALVAWGQRAFSSHTGLLAGALWLGTPLVAWLGASAGVDAGLTLFVTLGLCSFFNWIRGKEKSWLMLSAVFIGFAAASKYSALLFFGSLGLATLYWGILDRKWTYPVLFGAICSGVAGSWYLYNWYYTGNPVFPFLGDIFGYRVWSPEDLRSQMGELQFWGTGRTLSSFLLLPWNLAFNQQKFHLTEAPLFPFYIPGLLVAALLSIKNSSIRGLVGLSVGYILYWFFSAQVLRYLMPVIPLLCLLIAVLFEQGMGAVPFLKERKFQAGLTALAVTILLSVGAVYAGAWAGALGPLPVSPAERDAFYPKSWIGYDAIKFLNNQKGMDYSVYGLGNSYMAYFADGTFMGDAFGPSRYNDVTRLASGQELYQKLRSLDATHLLVDLRETALKFPKYNLPQDEFFFKHFKLVYARPYIRLYELGDTPLQRDIGPQLLRNPSFEELEGQQPIGWLRSGKPVIDGSGTPSHTGLTAVQIQGDLNVYSQAVPVEPGRLYLLGEYARAAQQKQKLRLQVNWSDMQGQLLNADVEVVEADSNWRYYEMAVTAPKGAAFATIYASADGQGVGWFDDFSFAQVTYEPK